MFIGHGGGSAEGVGALGWGDGEVAGYSCLSIGIPSGGKTEV